MPTYSKIKIWLIQASVFAFCFPWHCRQGQLKTWRIFSPFSRILEYKNPSRRIPCTNLDIYSFSFSLDPDDSDRVQPLDPNNPEHWNCKAPTTEANHKSLNLKSKPSRCKRVAPHFVGCIDLYCQHQSIVCTQNIIITAMTMDADISVSSSLPPFASVSLSHTHKHSLALGYKFRLSSRVRI